MLRPPTRKLIASSSLLKTSTPIWKKKRITALGKSQAKAEQCNRRNNVETGILNDILNNELKKKVIKICNDSNTVIKSSNIEGKIVPVKTNHYSKSFLTGNIPNWCCISRIMSVLKIKCILIACCAHITVYYKGSVKSFTENPPWKFFMNRTYC